MSGADGPAEPVPPALLSPRLARWLLSALVIWSFLLRLAFASYGLHPGRFYDERYSLENLRAVLAPAPEASGIERLRPANGWYPSLSYLPQVPVLAASRALYRWTGNPRFAVFRDGDPDRDFTPTAYFLCRATVAGFGALTLVLTFLAGRRLFGAGVALLGTLILAASPAHLRGSAMFKPDMLVVLWTLAVFLLALRLAEEHTREPAASVGWRRWAAAGLAVGLAAASKLNGLLTGFLPAAVAAARAMGERRWRALAGLVVSGASAAAAFLLLNPFVGLYAEYLGRNLRIYGERAELAGLDRPAAFRAVAEQWLAPGFHGPWLGAVAVAGLVALGVAALRRDPTRRGNADRRLRGLVPFWVVAYGVSYAATAAYPKPNNLLPVLPFTSLAAAWAIVAVVRAAAGALHRTLATRRPLELRRHGARWGRLLRGVGVAMTVLGVVLLLAPLHLHAYRTAVPSTRELLERTLRRELRPFAGRTVLYQGPVGEEGRAPVLLTRREAVAVIPVAAEGGGIGGMRAEARRLADAEVVADEEEGAAVAALGDDSPAPLRFEPSFGRSWGPTLVARIHPWELVERSRHWAEDLGVKEGSRRWSLPPPPLPTDPASGASPDSPPRERVLSIQVLVRDPEPPRVALRLEVTGRPVPLHATRVQTGGYVYGTAYTSRRFGWSEGEEMVVVLPTAPSPRPPVADVLVWRPPSTRSRR